MVQVFETRPPQECPSVGDVVQVLQWDVGLARMTKGDRVDVLIRPLQDAKHFSAERAVFVCPSGQQLAEATYDE